MATVGEGAQKRYVSFRATKHEREAIVLEKQGFKALKRIAIVSRTSKYEDAVAYFQQAADLYKADAKWRKAGECYARAADAEKKMENVLTAATFFVDAAEAFIRVDPLDAVRFYKHSIALFAKVGRFASAAMVQRRIGEIHEEDEAWDDAAESYQLAADFYAGEHMYTQAIFCLGRAGTYMAEAGRYDEAVDRFVAAATMCRDDNMQKFNAPGFHLNGVLCWLCSGDVEAALEQFEESMVLDFFYAGSRHARFSADLIESTADFDIHRYMDHVWNFDNVEPFSPMQLTLLERLAQLIAAGPPKTHESVVASDEDSYLSSDEEDSSEFYSSDDDESEHTDGGSEAASTRSGTTTRQTTTTRAGATSNAQASGARSTTRSVTTARSQASDGATTTTRR